MPLVVTATARDERPTVPAVRSPRPLPPRKRLNGTPQQEALFAALTGSDSHVTLIARAGTGKSWTCREGIWRLLEADPATRCSYVAFNRAIADDFQRGLPPGATATTMHSAGFSALKAAVRGVGDEPVKYKMHDIVDSLLPRRGAATRHAKAAVVKLAELCKGYLLDGTDAGDLDRLCAAHGVNPEPQRRLVYGLVPALLKKCAERSSLVCFSDMTWLPVVLGIDFPPYDVLFVDEAQDLDACQHALITRIAGSGRLCVVGDPRQAIYSFRGASTRSIDTLSTLLADTPRGLTTLPLTMTRRCPTSHVEFARNIVTDFEALPDAPEGWVDENADPWGHLEPGVTALCRTNAPLVSAAYALVASNVPVAIQGKDIGEGLVRLVESFDAPAADGLAYAVECYRARETARLAALENTDGEVEHLNDQCGAILAASRGCVLTSEVVARVRSLFLNVGKDDQSRYVLLSSVHRAKGREAEHVVVLNPELMPHRMAKTPEAIEQELNLIYVAATRSRDRLSFCGPIPEPLLV